MPAFASEDWCRRAIELLNSDPDTAKAASGWDGDFGIVLEGPQGPVAAWVGPPHGGRLPEPEFVSLEVLRARAPRYYAQATQDDWRALVSGSLDPIAALVQKRLVARGDLTPIIARLKYRGLAHRWLARLRSEG